MIKQPSATFLWKTEVFNFKNSILFLPVNISFFLRVGFVTACHLLYDPRNVNIFNCCIIYIFTISKNSNVVTNLHNLFKTMGNIYDGNALGI